MVKVKLGKVGKNEGWLKEFVAAKVKGWSLKEEKGELMAYKEAKDDDIETLYKEAKYLIQLVKIGQEAVQSYRDYWKKWREKKKAKEKQKTAEEDIVVEEVVLE